MAKQTKSLPQLSLPPDLGPSHFASGEGGRVRRLNPPPAVPEHVPELSILSISLLVSPYSQSLSHTLTCSFVGELLNFFQHVLELGIVNHRLCRAGPFLHHLLHDFLHLGVAQQGHHLRIGHERSQRLRRHATWEPAVRGHGIFDGIVSTLA